MAAGRKAKYPLEVKVGSAVVSVVKEYFGGSNRYRLVYYQAGIRKRMSLTDPEEAERKANEIAGALDRGEVNILAFSRQDGDSYLNALRLLKPLCIPLEPAVLEYAEAKKVAGARNLVEIARYYAKRFPVDRPDYTVKEVVDKCLADCQARNLSNRYIATIKYHFNLFTERFHCPIASVTSTDVKEFLRELDLSPRTLNNILGSLRTVGRFAKDHALLPFDFDEFERVKPSKLTSQPIDVWTPSEMRRLLRSASPEFMPALAIGAFAGLRSQEIERLDWSDIKNDSGVILVRSMAGGERNKTGKRTVPMSPNLKLWLEKVTMPKEGPVWTLLHDDFYEHQAGAAAATGEDGLPPLVWRHNATRHSFISYRVQQTQNLPQVALEAGNSPDMIRKHYQEVELPDGKLITPREAEEWFSIVPN